MAKLIIANYQTKINHIFRYCMNIKYDYFDGF